MDHRPPKLQKDHFIELARSVFGSAKWTTWQVGVLAIIFLVLLNLFSTSVYDLAKGQFHCSQLVYIFLFVPSVVLVLWIAQDAAARINLDIVQTDNPPQCKALILILSPPGPADASWIELMLKEKQPGDITNNATRERFAGSWRMPIEAIAYHLPRLDTVVLLSSSDAPNQEDGTFRDLALFTSLVRHLTREKKTLRLISLHEIDSRWDKGVDYETAQALVEALQQTFQWLRAQGIGAQDIIIDITGGQKIPTVAGAAVALGQEQRWFQYVSRRDYRVRAYDITYRTSTDF